jgi:hypothetical protein
MEKMDCLSRKRHRPVITLWLVAWTDGWIYSDCWVGVVDRDGTVLVWVIIITIAKRNQCFTWTALCSPQ